MNFRHLLGCDTIELCPEGRRATSGSSIKNQVLGLKTLPIFSPLKIYVTDHIAKVFTHKKVISKGADCSCITVAALALSAKS